MRQVIRAVRREITCTVPGIALEEQQLLTAKSFVLRVSTFIYTIHRVRENYLGFICPGAVVLRTITTFKHPPSQGRKVAKTFG